MNCKNSLLGILKHNDKTCVLYVFPNNWEYDQEFGRWLGDLFGVKLFALHCPSTSPVVFPSYHPHLSCTKSSAKIKKMKTHISYIQNIFIYIYIESIYKCHSKEHVHFHITHQFIFSQQLYKNHPKSCPMFPAQIWTAANACFLMPRGIMSNPNKIPTTVLVTCLRMRIVWTEFGFSWISRGNVSIKFVSEIFPI